MVTESGKPKTTYLEKEHLVKTLTRISQEKQRCYMRIEAIKKEEETINRRLGEIYNSTRTDI
jgi:hypothetical protein